MAYQVRGQSPVYQQACQTMQSCSECGLQVISLAIFVIGCVSFGSGMSGIVAGGAVVGLSVPILIYGVVKARRAHIESKSLSESAASEGEIAKFRAAGKACKRDIKLANVVYLLALIIIGSLVISGGLQVKAIGWTVIGSMLVSCAMSSMCARSRLKGSTAYVIQEAWDNIPQQVIHKMPITREGAERKVLQALRSTPWAR